MSGLRGERSGLAVMAEMLELTRKMAASGDADFLISSIDKRQSLIDEYELLKAPGSPATAELERDKAEIGRIKGEIVELDKKIDVSLKSMMSQTKAELENSVSNAKVLNYTNNAISSSGSYMDYKK